MKYIVLLFILINFSSHGSLGSDGSFFCAYPVANKAKTIIRKSIHPFARDKYVHCSVSCAVGVVCGVTSSAMIGVAKELYDLVGPGNVEISDLYANYKGIVLSQNSNIGNLSGCSKACKKKYPF